MRLSRRSYATAAAVWTGAAVWGRVGHSKGPWGDGLGKGSYGGTKINI
jgi:hypothetical protein